MRPFVVTRVDQNRTVELTRKVNETLVPQLSKLQGFKGYHDRVRNVSSARSDSSRTRSRSRSRPLASSWVRDEKLETAFPNPPKITSGKIVAQSNGVAVAQLAGPKLARRRRPARTRRFSVTSDRLAAEPVRKERRASLLGARRLPS